MFSYDVWPYLHSLHDMHNVNAYWDGHVARLPVHMIQLENRWTDLDEI
jgi:hypothetical protein